MNSFKLHLGFIFPLLLICFCFQFTFFIDELIKHYEKNLNKDYSVVIVSEQKIENVDLKHIKYFESISELDTSVVLEKLKGDISTSNLNILKAKLPKFYNVKFSEFVSETEVKNIKKQLLKIPNVLKVETFSKTHIKIYKLLVIIKFISYICLVFVSSLSVVLFFKQIKIWLYEHKDRIYILNLFGANFFQRASKMLKMVFIDNIICFILLAGFFINFNNIPFINYYFQSLEIELPIIDFMPSLIKVSLISLFACVFCVILVLFKAKK